jgi:methylated-DNA-[protein]-cysteine S-methyltransferase
MESENRMTTPSCWINQIKATPLGPISLAANESGLIRVFFGDVDGIKTVLTGEISVDDREKNLHLAAGLLQLDEYLHGKRREFELSIDWGIFKPFAAKVSETVFQIPCGEVRTYGEVAAAAGSPKAARAVGGVMANNPILILIPCHRVVGSDGSLHGYSGPGGLKTKAWLLGLEGYNV